MGKLILNGIPYGDSEGKRGISQYKEIILYDATDATFKNITLSDSILNYDAVIFHVHDTAYTGTNNAQQSGGFIYSRADILGCFSSNSKLIWLAGYGNTNATYTLTDETHLTANTNVTSVCNRIIGVKYGKCDVQYIQGALDYSEEEKVIGTWTDNKPIYQKTFHKTMNITSTSRTWYTVLTTTDLSPSNIDTFLGAGKTVMYDNNGVFITSLPYSSVVGSSGAVADTSYENGEFLVLLYNVAAGTYDIYITIQYTKTTDSANSGGYQAYGFTPIIYSEQEREVGVWVNNKPLYVKSWVETIPNTSGIYAFSAPISDLDIVCHTEYTIRHDGEVGYAPWYNNASILFAGQGSTGFEYYFASGYFAGEQLVHTAYYTKTTDIAGSGKYNTLGVPTEHYSENEQVVGTWTNGKPLYQKTFTQQLTGTTGSIDITSLNVATGWIYDGFYDIGVTTLGLNESMGGNNVTYTHLNAGLTPPYIDCKNAISQNSTIHVTIRYTKTTD